MIVEDDTLVRLGIKSLVPWTEMGLEVVCEAADGVEAASLFQTYAPDITLVDIGLPKGNGLDFIEHARTIRPDAEFVILTCNKDFELVRKSLRLGVRDFVMKSTMEIEELTGVIRSTAELVRTRKAAKDSDKTLTSIKQQAFLQDWLNGICTSVDLIAAKSLELGLQTGSFPSFEAWVIRLNMHARNGEDLLPPDLDKIGYAIGNVASELYKSQWIGMVPDLRSWQWHALIGSAALPADPQLLAGAVRQYLGFGISIGISEPFIRPNLWANHDRAALLALEHNYYASDTSIFKSGIPLLSRLPDPIHIWKKEMVKHFTLLRLDESLLSLSAFHASLDKPPFPLPELVRQLFGELRSELYSVYSHMEAASKPTASGRSKATFTDTVHQLSMEIQALQRQLSANRAVSEKKRIVQAVEEYVRVHIMDEISLTSLADTMNISAPYLSRLFKDETGSSFTDFVLHIKAEQATKMMKNGLAVTEVAEKLGYMNLSSFSRMFKKLYGKAPSHYSKEGDDGSAAKDK
ncbi:helix-turn-helix domain-containing protein [Paenibacillus mendelii]|uniref:Helix-turn-helix domain-containing protein n=1 Tax=Paenibacillus mendelii TaxID=206163 RepID=A0ABV6J740_9BACL|nr:helix-turn-helix domain-containing protein [Paenibacillus mendelii]MCQ6564041.1 helix-turn-helix domain-containing protein [Paenibacillus mendelii]